MCVYTYIYICAYRYTSILRPCDFPASPCRWTSKASWAREAKASFSSLAKDISNKKGVKVTIKVAIKVAIKITILGWNIAKFITWNWTWTLNNIDMIWCPCDQKSQTNTSRSRHQWHCAPPAGRVTSPGAQQLAAPIKIIKIHRASKQNQTKSNKNMAVKIIKHMARTSLVLWCCPVGLICPGFEAVPLRHVQNRGQRQLSEGPLPVRHGVCRRCQAPERHLRRITEDHDGHNGGLDPSATLGNALQYWMMIYSL